MGLKTQYQACILALYSLISTLCNLFLRFRHVRGVLPTIALKNEEGETQRSLNIEKWDTDTITAFLNDWLEGF